MVVAKVWALSLSMVGVAALLLGTPASGQAPTGAPAAPTAPAASPEETLGLTDAELRMTVPVNIGARGPFDFIVDTGSERTLISRELAEVLALNPGPVVTVHSMTEVSRISTVVLPGLRVGQRTLPDISAPSLARSDLGAAGILGIDTLQSARVTFDFARRQMTVMPSQRTEGRWPAGTIVVTARSRFGRLMLINASVDGQRVRVIVDSGSEVTVANTALRRALERRRRLGPITSITALSVTGGRFVADYAVAQLIRIGDATIAHLPIAFADVHPFRQLQLIDQPALLLGMDALRLFPRVSLDFANRQVKFLVPDSLRGDPFIHMAAMVASLPGR